jgi:SAM-dependent methyltransferase
VSRHVWTPGEVADTAGPAANVRNYLEQRDVRRCLARAAETRPIRRAADVGCGYGRLTMILTEFAPEVVGFERETAFVDEARRLLPSIRFVPVDSLAALGEATGSFDFAMIFTVLQHMPEAEAHAVLEEVKRIAAGGAVLLTEETDPALRDGAGAAGSGLTVGRPEATFVAWMRPFELVLRLPRVIEPGYARTNVGTHMLFRDPRPPAR